MGDVKPNEIIKNPDKNAKLTPTQLKLNKLGALFLLTSRGIIMIQSGQEFARSKVIPLNVKVDDPQKGMTDHNSYDKDNETNYINYKYVKANKELFDYYKGLIELRKNYESFRIADYNEVRFMDVNNNEFVLGYEIKHDDENFVVLSNADMKNSVVCELPEGVWDVLVNPEKAGTKSIGKVERKITIEPSSGYVLLKK